MRVTHEPASSTMAAAPSIVAPAPAGWRRLAPRWPLAWLAPGWSLGRLAPGTRRPISSTRTTCRRQCRTIDASHLRAAAVQTDGRPRSPIIRPSRFAGARSEDEPVALRHDGPREPTGSRTQRLRNAEPDEQLIPRNPATLPECRNFSAAPDASPGEPPVQYTQSPPDRSWIPCLSV